MIRKMICLSCIVIFLVGCWDQRLLKDHSLILAIGYDLQQDRMISKTVTFPKESVGGSQESNHAVDNEIVTAIGRTVKDADGEVDRKIPMKFDRSKTKVIVLGEDLAKDGMFKPLDSLYRDLRGPLNAKIAVITGTAEDALSIQDKYSQTISSFYFELLRSAENSGFIADENVQSICPVLLSVGQDIVLPHIDLTDNVQSATVSGLALFSGDQMTDTLNIDQSMIYLILSDHKLKRGKLNLKVSDKHEKDYDNYVDFSIRKQKRKMQVEAKDHVVSAVLDISLRIEIDEYSSDHLSNEAKAKQLAKEIERQLEILGDETIAKIQQANSDALGIGQKVKAYHHNTWETVDWKEVYPEIDIDINFNVEIMRYGIMN